MLSSTLILPGESVPMNDGGEIRERLEREIELVLDGGACGIEPSTVIDLTGPKPQLVRAGVGDLAPFGLDLAVTP